MPNRLDSLTIEEVSIVDRPANSSTVDGKKIPRARIALFKRDGDIKKEEGGKTEDGVVFPASDYAYVPEKDKPSTWKLRLTSSPGGKPDVHIVGAAVAALGPGGFRGNQVEIPAEALSGVKAKVRAAWQSANSEKGVDEMPEILRKGEVPMSIDEVVKKIEEQDAIIATLKADSDASRAETAAVLKMSQKERNLYATLPEEKQKEFMAGDEEKRKAIMASCDKAAKSKAGFKPDEPGAGDGTKPEVEEDPVEPDEDDMVQERAKKIEKILKAAEESSVRLRKAEEQLAEFAKRDQLNRFTKRAETELPNTAGLPEDKGEFLMTQAASLPGGENGAAFKKMMGFLKAADKALSIQFGEVGRPGGEIRAEAALNAKAAEIAKRDNTDIHHAMAKAASECPELYVEYERERRESFPRQ